MLLAGPVMLFLLWSQHLQAWLSLEGAQADTFGTYGFAWTGGLLGGAVFTTKWLYHSVAHGLWNEDRLLWRLFTPHLSAAFAFGLIALATSGLIDVIDAPVLKAPAAMVGVAFLLGAFSDLTVARLARTAQSMLGGKGDGGTQPDAPRTESVGPNSSSAAAEDSANETGGQPDDAGSTADRGDL